VNFRTSATLLALLFLASTAAPGPALASRVPTGTAPAPVRATTTVPFSVVATPPVTGGVSRRSGSWTTDNGPQVVELIDVDPTATGISLEAAGPAAGVNAVATVRSQAGRVSRDGHRVVAAVNGDTFATDAATGVQNPGGLHVHEGELYSGSVTVRPTLGLGGATTARLGDVAVSGSVTLPDGVTTLAIDRVNKARRSGDLVLYSRRWGTSTHALSNGTEVVLAGAALPLRVSGTWTATVAKVVPAGGNSAIAAGSLVLSAQGADAAPLAGLAIGSTVSITLGITPGWEDVVEAIGGREWAVEAAQPSIRPVSSFTTYSHPRTAVGIHADGHLVLATVDGRWPGYSIGVTAGDLADLLVGQGVSAAIILDGGGSTTALARIPGDVEATVINRPSDGRERAVANSLLVVSAIPSGPLAGVVVRPASAATVVGETVAFRARGVDAALNGVSMTGVPVAWAMTGSGGTLGTGGSFLAQEPGDATITATTGPFSASATASVVADTFPPLASAPVVRLRRSAIVNADAVPVTVSWAAATDVGTGVVRYDLRRRLDGGDWQDVGLATPTSRSIVQSLPTTRAVQYQVRATDAAGNAGAWKSSAAFHLRLASERSSAVKYARTWTTSLSSAYLGGAVKRSRVRGATASYTFTGSQVAWIAARGPTRGKARVYLDGTYAATVNLNSSTVQTRRAVYTFVWATAGRHRITIRVSGTAGHPRVDVDGFAVADAASAYPVLVGAGDVASCGLTGDSATASLIDRIPGTVFVAGDTAYETGSAAEFANCYAPTWGRFRARTRPVPGNHEYGSPGAAPYFAYFGPSGGNPGEGWYAYDLGGWRIYGLNSNCASVGGCGPGSPQEAWLRADLAANPRACVAAIWHHPLFTSGVHGGTAATQPLWQALYEAGAELVINGHDHDYERFAPQRPDGSADQATGIREIVAGTGGAGLRSFAATQPNSEVRKTGVHGVLKLELKAAGYTWGFVPEAGSTWTDGGSASCH